MHGHLIPATASTGRSAYGHDDDRRQTGKHHDDIRLHANGRRTDFHPVESAVRIDAAAISPRCAPEHLLSGRTATRRDLRVRYDGGRVHTGAAIRVARVDRP